MTIVKKIVNQMNNICFYNTTVTIFPHNDGQHCGDCRFIKNGRICSIYDNEILEIEKVNNYYFCIRSQKCLKQEYLGE